MLGDSDQLVQIKGRANDKSLGKQLLLHGDASLLEDRVKLSYTDKQGNQLTVKQAFREFCWKFHGKGPSHRQKDKSIKNLEAQGAPSTK